MGVNIRRITRLDPRRFHPVAPLNQNNTEPLRRLASHDEVVAEHAVGDPFLRVRLALTQITKLMDNLKGPVMRKPTFVPLMT